MWKYVKKLTAMITEESNLKQGRVKHAKVGLSRHRMGIVILHKTIPMQDLHMEMEINAETLMEVKQFGVIQLTLTQDLNIVMSLIVMRMGMDMDTVMN